MFNARVALTESITFTKINRPDIRSLNTTARQPLILLQLLYSNFYTEPFARDGQLTLFDYDGIAPEDGSQITIGIKNIQMEQDTAKTVQEPPSTHLLDFNRVSHPLIEIITFPHIHHPATAAACVRKIQAILKSVNACTAGMEVGGLRADVNVSVRRRHEQGNAPAHSYYGVNGLGQRTEIKNLSSVKAVEDAIIAERNRQIRVLEAGGSIDGETRGWSLGSSETRKLRGKEGEIDYRYMPDPDIPPVIVAEVRSFFSPLQLSHANTSRASSITFVARSLCFPMKFLRCLLLVPNMVLP